MGLMERLFGKKEHEKKELEPDEMGEVPEPAFAGHQSTIIVDKIDSYASCDRIIRQIKSNNIVIAKIKDLKDTNMDELKQSVNRIKTAVTSLNGDIAGVGEEWLIITPKTAKVHRQEDRT